MRRAGAVWSATPKTYPDDPTWAIKVATGEPENDDLLENKWQIGSRFTKTTGGGRPCILMEEGFMDVARFVRDARFSRPESSPVSRVCELAPQLIHLLKEFHGAGYIHRDVKLSNFMACWSKSRERYVFKIADLGYAIHYLDDAGCHIAEGSSRYVGTPAFSSKNADVGRMQSRRDDLESLAYGLIYTSSPSSIPWRGKPYDEVWRMKAETPSEIICRGLPSVFAKFLDYCSNLEFEEQPEYDKWAEEFLKAVEEPKGNPSNVSASAVPEKDPEVVRSRNFAAGHPNPDRAHRPPSVVLDHVEPVLSQTSRTPILPSSIPMTCKIAGQRHTHKANRKAIQSDDSKGTRPHNAPSSRATGKLEKPSAKKVPHCHAHDLTTHKAKTSSAAWSATR
ncbi:hypothetical protein FS837_001158 [Tulasnella sp. UAMH 9824]|nr:hypothetical protein FS837_001158 [Tulasnella sp. UAMH 9824]